MKKEPSFSAQTFSRTTMKQWKKADNCSQVPNKNQTWNSETPVKLTKITSNSSLLSNLTIRDCFGLLGLLYWSGRSVRSNDKRP